MKIIDLHEKDAIACLGTLKFLAESTSSINGLTADIKFIEAVIKYLTKLTINYHQITAVSPDNISQYKLNKDSIITTIKLMVMSTLINQQVDTTKLALLKKYSKSLNYYEKSIDILEYAVKGKIRKLRHAIRIRAFGGTKKNQSRPFKNLLLSWQTELLMLFGRKRFRGEDPALTQKFRQLDQLPDGTMGKEYCNYMAANNFPYPGEKFSAAQFITPHDLTHVLSGYDTTPEQETQVLFFTAGYQNQDPIYLMLFAMFLFHAGIPSGLIATPFKGSFDADYALKAYNRGRFMNIDLQDNWDYWKVIDQPVTNLRKLYNISQ